MANDQQENQRNGSPHTEGATREHPGSRPSNDRPQGKKGGKGKFLLIVLGLVIVLAILAAFGITGAIGRHRERDKTAQAVEAGAMTVRVTKPSKSPPVFDFSLPGSSEPLTTATLYARVNGYLKARYVDIGDQVEAGQLLAEIDAPDLDAQLMPSRAQLEQTRAAAGIAQGDFRARATPPRPEGRQQTGIRPEPRRRTIRRSPTSKPPRPTCKISACNRVLKRSPRRLPA